MVQLKSDNPCTIIYKPEFTILGGEVGKIEFENLWENYMLGIINLKDFYPFGGAWWSAQWKAEIGCIWKKHGGNKR